MTTSCPSTSDLRGLVNGSLSDSEADSLQLHLERCETCQNALQEIVADGDFWKSASEKLSDDEAAGPELERIVDELQHQSPEDAEEMGEAIELKLSFIDPPTEPGTIGRLKHYDILRVAGRGGMGIVLKAFDRTLRRVVAVKMLAPHLAGNGQAKQRFIREGRAAAGICHEHVVTIHAVEESPPFIVMQYVKGETLEARIHRNGSLEIREAVRIAKQIAQGLAAAHTQGVVHRDIKPANILLENGVARVRITDFGLARAVDDASLTQSGVVAGTPQYMAPEQASGDAVDERADLFSLGSVLYTMLAGHAPFRATTTMGVLKRLCDHNARPIREINPDVPDWLVVMINRLHAKRPADRYQTAQEVADVLERGLAALQNGAAPTVDLPVMNTKEQQSVPTQEAVESPLPIDFSEVRRTAPQWIFRPIPLWLIMVPAILVLFVAMPHILGRLNESQLEAFYGTAIAVVVISIVLNKLKATDKSTSNSQGNAQVKAGLMHRATMRLSEIAPRTWLSTTGWLTAWCIPVAVCVSFFILQETWAVQMPVESLPDRDRDIIVMLIGIFCWWWLVASLWFRRRRSDGTRLFPQGRWKRVLPTLILAGIFCGFCAHVWYWEVHRRRLSRDRNMQFADAEIVDLSVHSQTVSAPTLRVDFEVAVDGQEVVIDFPDGNEVKFTPAHHGVMVQLSESAPGTYGWRATLKGLHVASGKVTLAAGQLAEIKVPRPKLIQMIAGRWESAPETNGLSAMALDGGAEGAAIQYEFEFEKERATFAMRASGKVDRSQFRVRIDESVTPALIDLSMPDGQQLMGIVKFQAGRKRQFQDGGSGMMSPTASGNSEMSMDFESMGGNAAGYASPGGSSPLGFGAAPMGSASEPDRLLICVTEGIGLRPWEFQADDTRGQMLFVLVRSRESGSLRETLAFEPVELGTSPDLIKESVQAWSKRLKIDSAGINSIGMDMVLVPPAAYHLFDQPHLSALRRQLPEPGSIRNSIENDPTFKYEFPPKLKQQLRTTQKSVSYPFVMSRRLVTIDQFQQFVDETGYVTDAEKGTPLLPEEPSDSEAESSNVSDSPERETVVVENSGSNIKGGWLRQDRLFNWAYGLDWQSEKSSDEQDRTRSASVISWSDATEFCKWLSEKEGRQYRLPKNEEWTAAMQLGAALKPLPATNSDEPMIHDYHGWFDAKGKHPLKIIRTNSAFAEWTQDAQFVSKRDRKVLVHYEESADGVRFYSGTQFTADKSFRAAEVGFRVVAELQVLAAGNTGGKLSGVPSLELSE